MKGLIFLMIVCSLFVNFTVNKFGLLAVYKMEFPNSADYINSDKYDFSIFIIWALLLVSHAGTISLLFLNDRKYFPELLFCAPLLFILFFLFFNLMAIPLLFPFIFVWLVALSYQKAKKINIKIKTEVLLLTMILCFIFAAFPRNGATLFQIGSDLSAAFSAIKSGDNRLMAILWLLLIASNVALISLLFFRKKEYFRKLLIWVPALYLSLFIVCNYLAFFFLIPFIIIWAVALIREEQQKIIRLAICFL